MMRTHPSATRIIHHQQRLAQQQRQSNYYFGAQASSLWCVLCVVCVCIVGVLAWSLLGDTTNIIALQTREIKASTVEVAVDKDNDCMKFTDTLLSAFMHAAPQQMLPVSIHPPRPENCDYYDPECAETIYPGDYYSVNSINSRSRQYVSHHSPYLQHTHRNNTSNGGDNSAPDETDPRKTENINRLNRLFARLGDCKRMNATTTTAADQRRRPITITVLGGSLTAGRFVGGYNGAWPALLQHRLQAYLNQTCGVGRIDARVINHAEPATTSSWALHHFDHLFPSYEDSDLVIVDYDVNDCALISDSNSSYAEVQGITELLVRKVLTLPSPAIIFLNVAVNHRKRPLRGECYMHNTCYSMDHIRQPVLSAYNVPIVSAKAAVWTNFSCPPPPSVWPCSSFCSHPLEAAHEMLANITADFVLYGVERYVEHKKRVERASKNFGNDRYRITKKANVADLTDVRIPCMTPVTQLPPLLQGTDDMDALLCHRTVSYLNTARSQELFARSTNSNNNNKLISPPNDYSSDVELVYRDDCWSFIEDVPGKPGWIGTGCINRSIVFRIAFGHDDDGKHLPSLTITVLSTYPDDTGVIEVSIKKLETKVDTSTNEMLEAGFLVLGAHDLQRDENDYKHYSISTPILYNSLVPSNKQGGGAAGLFTQFYDVDDNKMMAALNLSDSMALVKIVQVDGNDKKYLSRMKQKFFEPRMNPQKVKIISLHTC
jgi:hypothetical protein